MNKSKDTHVAAVQICAGLLALLVCAPALALAQARPIRTESGLVSGVALAHGLEVFKGIPFAAPPVGKLRWQPPRPPAAWQGVLKAASFGAPCMQSTSPERASSAIARASMSSLGRAASFPVGRSPRSCSAQRLHAGPAASASRQPRLPQPQSCPPGFTTRCPTSPAMPEAPS